jgi:hypothetical protein
MVIHGFILSSHEAPYLDQVIFPYGHHLFDESKWKTHNENWRAVLMAALSNKQIWNEINSNAKFGVWDGKSRSYVQMGYSCLNI